MLDIQFLTWWTFLLQVRIGHDIGSFLATLLHTYNFSHLYSFLVSFFVPSCCKLPCESSRYTKIHVRVGEGRMFCSPHQYASSCSFKEVYDDICAVPNVTHVHDLHIWSISHGKAALTVHCFSDDRYALRNINAVCTDHGIYHSTIQVQQGGNSKNPVCPTCDPSQFSCYEHVLATAATQETINEVVWRKQLNYM